MSPAMGRFGKHLNKRGNRFSNTKKARREIQKNIARQTPKKSFFEQKADLQRRIKDAKLKLDALRNQNASPEAQEKAIDDWKDLQRQFNALSEENARRRKW